MLFLTLVGKYFVGLSLNFQCLWVQLNCFSMQIALSSVIILQRKFIYYSSWKNYLTKRIILPKEFLPKELSYQKN